jgi:2-polyprenyl-3-methyl-5-hydroxy-6-metoxy-1,4-benzoquinol methylase
MKIRPVAFLSAAPSSASISSKESPLSKIRIRYVLVALLLSSLAVAQGGQSHFDALYRDRNQAAFTTEPNAFLVSAIKDIKPRKALDVATGQGRNAVYLATKGWDVTGFDISEEGLKAANENAAKAGVVITTLKARLEDFDYGTARWDLICFIYVPTQLTVDSKFIARIRTALKPGGLMLYTHKLRSLSPTVSLTESDKLNALLKAWSDLQVVFYEETIGTGEWFRFRGRILRLLARKL